jgi:single-strand DNA-binding protein
MLNITAHGNLGKDPELKQTNNNSQVANFSLAARTGKDETTWINCQVWGTRADTVMQYLHKGDRITVAGSGKLQEYDRRDGGKGYSLQLRVNDFTLPAKADAPGEGQSKSNFDF